MTKITTILFDLDGTIVNTNEVILQSLTETLEDITGRSWTRDELLPHWGKVLRRQLVLFHPEIDLERAIASYRERYAENHVSLLAEFPGVRPLLERLRHAGYKLGVVTSKKRAACEQTLDDIGYRALFPAVVAEEDAPRIKPAPDPLLLAARRLGADPTECLYVGDNPDDLIAAHAAGMGAVAVSWTLRPLRELHAENPHAMLDTPEDLWTLLCARP